MDIGKAMPHEGLGTGADDVSAQAIFHAVITPHRSLDQRSFRTMMAVLAGAAALLGLRFAAFGLWPVAGFLGLDVVALYVAFRISYRRGRAFEEVILTPIELMLRRVSHRGQAAEWRLNPRWTRLERQSHEEFGLQRLLVVSRGQSIVVAGALSPQERAQFADAFSDALGRAKRGVPLPS